MENKTRIKLSISLIIIMFAIYLMLLVYMSYNFQILKENVSNLSEKLSTLQANTEELSTELKP